MVGRAIAPFLGQLLTQSNRLSLGKCRGHCGLVGHRQCELIHRQGFGLGFGELVLVAGVVQALYGMDNMCVLYGS